jgi:hypothetical protein
MMWLNKMKMAAGVVLAVVLAGTGVGLVVRETWAGGGEGQAGEAAAKAQKPTPKADAQEGTKAEIEELRKEVAKLRSEMDAALKEIKRIAAPPDNDAEIKKLLKERYEALSQAADLLRTPFREGKVKFDTLAAVQRDALEANLDLYESPTERVAALRKLLDGVTATYEMAKAQFQSGAVNIVVLHQAKAMILAARIALLREENKVRSTKSGD